MHKRISAATVALLGLTAAAAAQTDAPAVAQTCALPSVADTVELKDVPGSDLVTVPVTVNGKPKLFLLDIGTNDTEVSQAMVDELHLIAGIKRTEILQTGPAYQKGDLSRREFNVGAVSQVTIIDVKGNHNVDDGRVRVNIPSFTMGNATGHDLTFVVDKDNAIGKSAPYDGLMTGSFFKQYDVELDFYENKLNYLTPTSCIDPDQVVFWPHSAVAIIPMSMSGGKIEVQVSIQGHIINAVVDMSSAHTVMRRDIAERKVGLKSNTPNMMPDGDLVDGWGLPVYKALFEQISFAGGVTAINVPVQIQTNGMKHIVGRQPILGSHAQFVDDQRIPDLTLGMDVLHQLHLYIVPGQGNMYVTSAQ